MAIVKDVLIVGAINNIDESKVVVSNIDNNFPKFNFNSKYNFCLLID
jgi:hypothetical protein